MDFVLPESRQHRLDDADASRLGRETSQTSDIALLGLGPWGLAVFERIITAARRPDQIGAFTNVHVVEPGVPGVGAFAIDEPDYLILNTPCGWHSASPFPDDHGSDSERRTFFEWVQWRGYRWVNDECRIDPHGTPITRDDFLPRRLMGEYLAWCFEQLSAEAPDSLAIHLHRTSAVDVVKRSDRRETVVLADGSSFVADHVVLTTGHTDDVLAEVAPGLAPLRPYPISRFSAPEFVPAGTSVAIRGMGLVAHDVVTALTIGRGGIFTKRGERFHYEPSGAEPTIYLFSRSGYPYCAKSSPGIPGPSAAVYEPAILTPAAVAALRGGTRGGGDHDCSSIGRRLDARMEILPLLFAEMQVRFYVHSAHLNGGPTAAQQVRDRLTGAWEAGTFTECIEEYAADYGVFDARRHVLIGSEDEYLSAKDYEEKVYATVSADLDEATTPGLESPVKAAYAVPRVLRDALRSLIEFRGLTAQSQEDFALNIRNRLARLVAGPPTLRVLQLLALMDAGIVRMPFGPAPVVEPTSDGRFNIKSANLSDTYSLRVDYLIQGTLSEPRLRETASPLLRNLFAAGRLQECAWGDTVSGSVELSAEFNPINSIGSTESSLWIFGALTEGIRFYTGYLPSPKDRRASLDAEQCVQRMAAPRTSHVSTTAPSGSVSTAGESTFGRSRVGDQRPPVAPSHVISSSPKA